MSGTTLMLNPLDVLASQSPDQVSNRGYALKVFATNWGFDGTWDDFCARIHKAGYDGAELWYPTNQKDRNDLFTALKKFDLSVGFLVGSGEREPARHFEEFSAAVEGAAAIKPLYINCHSGRDHFNFDMNGRFIELTAAVSKSTGVPIYHETHRSRILYSAPATRDFIENHPDLRITFDVSHWCNVHESLLEDQAQTLNQVLERVDHIHARIGHPEGPQVNDPRAPEWKDAVNAHFSWWDKVVQRKKQEGKLMTFLTEFGPVDYMPALPYTRQPVGNQWEINKHMLDTLRARYA